ncbi:UDP-N-acetylmuramate--L-alanine ligase [Nafulsella turpanensis]|uniref:UDP-N-acetylmuramate--L-alanine ligase n=1 Tax=Nafulsella turpanensis TaxID=1265690 RepID=UPI000346E047|nr:Mur ligase family protein [Nafulsella turpanensis]
MNKNSQQIHFIAIGGSVMHHLAIALKKAGHQVTGSDDAFFDPSRSNLEKHGLLPSSDGWDASKIHSDLDAVILGMHARADNPELQKAQELGLKIYSFPEYIYQHSRDKQRVVIAGSHGKTTITSIILHVLRHNKREFDYLVGAELEGFDGMVKLSNAPLIIIEGDEYTTSPLDKTPKFLHYHHHIGLISGIAWDHMNVFPTEEAYVKQFELFADATPKGGSLVICSEDNIATIIANKQREDVNTLMYGIHPTVKKGEQLYLKTPVGDLPIEVFGSHNMQNISGAYQVCKRIGITDKQFYEAVGSFKGAAKRMQLLKKNEQTAIYRDFAHAPSKLEASVKALKEQFPNRHLLACLELHTFSSLNKDFLPQYNHSFAAADTPVVYYNPHVVEQKRMAPISEEDIKKAFGHEKLQVFSDVRKLEDFIRTQPLANTNLLMMSSAQFGGIDLQKLADKLI